MIVNSFFGIVLLMVLVDMETAAKSPSVGYGSDVNTKCAAGSQILGVFYSANNAFASSCSEPQICEKYFPTCTVGGSCGSPFNYVYEMKEVNGEPYRPDKKRRRRRKRGVHGRIVQKCCAIEKPKNEEVYEFCEVYSISHTDAKKIDMFKTGNFGAVGGPSTRYVQYIAKVPTGYTFKICYLQCTDTTTTRRPTTEGRELKEDILGEDFIEELTAGDAPPPQLDAGGTSCFPEDATVRTAGGEKRMDQLVAGDKVLTHSDTFSGHTFEPILFFLHREPETRAEFLEFTTQTGAKVQMTRTHMIPVVSCEAENVPLGNAYLGSKMQPANQVKIGSCLLVDSDGTGRVTPVVSINKLRRRGIYNPVTASGTIVVNGVHCGVYVSEQGGLVHYIAHTVFKFMKMFENLIGTTWDMGEAKMELSRVIVVALEAMSVL